MTPESQEPTDALFANPQRIEDFDFGARTAGVFDDMLHRSVPFYDEIQRMTEELAVDFATPGSAIYDLGCSTATTLEGLGRRLGDRSVRLVGVDYSADMLEQARRKLDLAGLSDSVELRHADLNEGIVIENASVVLLILTLQFVRPLRREAVLAGIHRGMNEGGCLLLVEKVLGSSSTLNRLFIEHYYEMKRAQGYSELEIAQKREALENVLIPYRLDENVELLRKVGFSTVEAYFKWYNFCALVAVR